MGSEMCIRDSINFDKALLLRPKLFCALFQKAISLRSLGKAEESVNILTKLLEKHPKNESISKQLLLSQEAHTNLIRPRTKVLIISGCTNRAYSAYLKVAFPDWDVRFVFESLAENFLHSLDKEYEEFLANLDIVIGNSDCDLFVNVLPKNSIKVKLPSFNYFRLSPRCSLC